MALNVAKNIMSVVFPLISFPYISKVLDVDGIGKFTFSSAIIDLFGLFAMLGITTYGIREGARIRDNTTELQVFANQIFTINLVSTAATYVTFLLILATVSKFRDYSVMLILLSLRILFLPFSVEWLFSIEEDYKYLTIRSIALQVISLVLLFIFVKSPKDLYVYAIIAVFSHVVMGIMGFFRARKYLHISIVKDMGVNKHIGSIFLIFSSSLASAIYVNSDVILLGILTNEHCVGIYSIAAKIYKIVRTLLSSVLIVSIPRLSALLGKDNKELFENTADSVLSTLLSFLFPTIFGLFILSQEVVLIVSNANFLEAKDSLKILCVALMLCMLAWYYGQCILLPNKEEKHILIATLISAMTNCLLNILLIPIWREKAAALTTLISEALALLICGLHARKYVNNKKCISVMIKVLVGCAGIIVCIITMKSVMPHESDTTTFISIVLSMCIYSLIEIVLKNEAFIEFFRIFLLKVKR